MFIFKYWVEFDEEGEIKALHKSKSHCEGGCEEFLVKLIPIEREDDLEQAIRGLNKEVVGFTKDLDAVKDLGKKVNSEVRKISDLMRRIK
jgi:hypothetical protein